MNYLIIVANVLIFIAARSLGSRRYEQVIFAFGMIPARLTQDHSAMALATMLSSMFLHGGRGCSWYHLVSNMWALFIFGDNVEDRLGPGRCLGFYVVGGVLAASAHLALAGGTLVALAANEIVMDGNSVLSPVDPQIGQLPAASIVAVTRGKPIADIDDETLIMADIAQKALDQVRNMVQPLLMQQCHRGGR